VRQLDSGTDGIRNNTGRPRVRDAGVADRLPPAPCRASRAGLPADARMRNPEVATASDMERPSRRRLGRHNVPGPESPATGYNGG
jgi:hypothetical protein